MKKVTLQIAGGGKDLVIALRPPLSETVYEVQSKIQAFFAHLESDKVSCTVLLNGEPVIKLDVSRYIEFYELTALFSWLYNAKALPENDLPYQVWCDHLVGIVADMQGLERYAVYLNTAELIDCWESGLTPWDAYQYQFQWRGPECEVYENWRDCLLRILRRQLKVEVPIIHNEDAVRSEFMDGMSPWDSYNTLFNSDEDGDEDGDE